MEAYPRDELTLRREYVESNRFNWWLDGTSEMEFGVSGFDYNDDMRFPQVFFGSLSR